jgi:hypothetical protein
MLDEFVVNTNLLRSEYEFQLGLCTWTKSSRTIKLINYDCSKAIAEAPKTTALRLAKLISVPAMSGQ